MINDEHYMRLALAEAKLALDSGEIPVGALIVRDNELIAKSHNLKETLKQATAHAEILAINEASIKIDNWNLNDCTLYVTLEPCSMCAGAIVHSRLKRVVIGALDNKDGGVVSSLHIFENNHNHKLLVKTKVLEKECNDILIRFFNEKR